MARELANDQGEEIYARTVASQRPAFRIPAFWSYFVRRVPPRGRQLLVMRGCSGSEPGRSSYCWEGNVLPVLVLTVGLCHLAVAGGAREWEWLLERDPQDAEVRRAPPAVVFLDEVDALGASRQQAGRPHEHRLISHPLIWLDGAGADHAEVLVRGATDSRWNVDPALRRPAASTAPSSCPRRRRRRAGNPAPGPAGQAPDGGSPHPGRGGHPSGHGGGPVAGGASPESAAPLGHS